MPTYVISMMSIHDPATYRKYTALTPAIVKDYGGRFLTRGEEVTTLEGEAFTNRMVILEFPSRERAEAWFKDERYVEAVKFRHASSTARVILQDGGVNMEDPDAKV